MKNTDGRIISLDSNETLRHSDHTPNSEQGVSIKSPFKSSNFIDVLCKENIEKKDILDICKNYMDSSFFELYERLEDSLIINNQPELNSFFMNVNSFYETCSYPLDFKGNYCPLDYIYNLYIHTPENESNIVSLRGNCGTGKSHFCEALFLYFLAKSDNNSFLPFIFNTDACYEKIRLGDGVGVWNDMKEMFMHLFDGIKILVNRGKKVVLILDGVIDPYQLAKDIVIRSITQSIKDLRQNENFKIILSEDSEDYFAKSEPEARRWLESSHTIMFEGCIRMNPQSIEKFVVAYSKLFQKKETASLLEKVKNTYPVFRLDLDFISKIEELSDGFFGIASYYYNTVFQIPYPENDRKIDLTQMMEVVKDIFIDGQIGNSWLIKNSEELALVLNDSYAFYFFLAYTFMERWKSAENFYLIHENDDFMNIIGNTHICFLDRRILYFIDFLYRRESIKAQVEYINRVKNYVDKFNADFAYLPIDVKENELKTINTLVFILSQLSMVKNDRIECEYTALLYSLYKNAGNFCDLILFDIWDSNKRIDIYACGYIHCMFHYAMTAEKQTTRVGKIFSIYLAHYLKQDALSCHILQALEFNLAGYWGVLSNHPRTLVKSLYAIEFELFRHNEGINGRSNALDFLIFSLFILNSKDIKSQETLTEVAEGILSNQIELPFELESFIKNKILKKEI